MFSNILSKFFINTNKFLNPLLTQKMELHILTTSPSVMSPGGAWSLLSSRTNIRNTFPRPREIKRIKVHGWNKRMSTDSGRRILMRRILKGRHVLSH